MDSLAATAAVLASNVTAVRMNFIVVSFVLKIMGGADLTTIKIMSYACFIDREFALSRPVILLVENGMTSFFMS